MPSSEIARYDLNAVGTKFISWRNITSLQIDTLRFRSPNYAPLHIVINDTTAVVSKIIKNLNDDFEFNTTFNAQQYFSTISKDDGIISHPTSHLLLFAVIGVVISSCAIATAIACHRCGIVAKYLKFRQIKNSPQLSKVEYRACSGAPSGSLIHEDASTADVDRVILPRN
jgi:hypothetical protein